MYFKSIKLPWLILGAASLVCSRIVFFFVNDPEGPNLLVVVGLAVILFSVSALAYKYIPPLMRALKRLFSARSILFSTFLIAVGIFLFVYGGYDDSPGAQGLGLLAAVIGSWRIWRRRFPSR